MNKRIENISTKIPIFIACGIILLGYYVIINSYIEGEIPTNWFIGKIVPIGLFFVAIWFYKSKKNLTFIFTLIALLLIISLHTFALQYNQPYGGDYIRSRVYIQKSQDFKFDSLKSSLVFDGSGAYLIESIFLSNMSDSVKTHIRFEPPKNTTYYEINISGKTRNYEYRELVYERDSLIPNRNPNFTLDFEPGDYNLKAVYRMENVKPNGRVSFEVTGKNAFKPKMKMTSIVRFSRLKYECLEPCAFPIPENSWVSPPTEDMIKNLNSKKPIYIFSVKAETDDLYFLLRTTERIYPAIRSLIFAFIVGLSASAVNILIKDRERYLKGTEKTLDKLRVNLKSSFLAIKNIFEWVYYNFKKYLTFTAKRIHDLLSKLWQRE